MCPFYEFGCDCGHAEEDMMSISSYEEEKKKPSKICPDCGKILVPLVSKNDFHLKGTRWYSTNYE